MHQYFPASKVIHTGNPVRASLKHLVRKRRQARKHFGLAPDKKCLLVLGGSLGAHTINESILHGLAPLLEAGLQLLWPTGHDYFERIKARLKPAQRAAVHLYPFIDAMDLAYAAADLVVARGGALVVAELCVAQKPTIFVPSPNVTGDHQTHNVWPLVEHQAALMIKDGEAMQALSREVIDLSRNENKQKLLAKHMGAWAKPQATDTIVEEAMQLARMKQEG